MNNNKKFHTRGFTAFITFGSFIIMALSGIMLFLVPKGSVASWTNWRIFGITKTGWEGIHDIFMFVFLVSIGMHIFLNWKPLLNYFRDRTTNTVRLKKELYISSGLILIILAGSITQIQPFWSIMRLNDVIKDYWKNTSSAPPVSDAEKFTLTELSQLLQTPLWQYHLIIKESDLVLPEGDPTFEEIALANELSPEQLYSIISTSIDSLKTLNDVNRGKDKK
ncbi:DUF4405 domain-containing protein [candidate division KSB1 bacterium]